MRKTHETGVEIAFPVYRHISRSETGWVSIDNNLASASSCFFFSSPSCWRDQLSKRTKSLKERHTRLLRWKRSRKEPSLEKTLVGLDFGRLGFVGGFELEDRAGDAYPLLDCGVGMFDILRDKNEVKCYGCFRWENMQKMISRQVKINKRGIACLGVVVPWFGCPPPPTTAPKFLLKFLVSQTTWI